MRHLVLVLLFLLAVPASASAGTVSINSGVVVFRAAPGEANNVTITDENKDIVIADSAIAAQAGTGCRTVAAFGRVACDTKRRGIGAVRIELGDRDDQLATEVSATIQGGAGDDVLRSDALGGTVLRGGGGIDQLRGGDGDDVFQDGDGAAMSADADSINGGLGLDTVLFNDRRKGVKVDLRHTAGQGEAGENDRYISIENVTGSPFADVIVGTSRPNVLVGGPGSDRLSGLRGNDSLQGSSGNDVLIGGEGNDLLADPGAAEFRCGAGLDRVKRANNLGRPRSDCEKVVTG